MGLLHEIQGSVVSESAEIVPILLKLRLLASRLGSTPLEDWVKHESEGYPADAPLPDYRKVGVNYTASFSGSFGSSIQNASIPPMVIANYVGEEWLSLDLRQSLASVDDLLGSPTDRSSTVKLDRSDLIFALQGKVYERYACNQVVGHISKAALTEIKTTVRAKILELTIALERSVPEASNIILGPHREAPGSERIDKVTSITHQIIHGNVTTINSNGNNATIKVDIRQGDVAAVAKLLAQAGISSADAEEFAAIVAAEKPTASNDPLGKRASSWIVENIGKAASGVWNIGVAAASAVLTEAAKKYYGL